MMMPVYVSGMETGWTVVGCMVLVHMRTDGGDADNRNGLHKAKAVGSTFI